MSIYLTINYTCTVIFEIKGYPMITYKDHRSFIFMGIAIVLSFLGWFLFYSLKRKNKVN